MKQFILIFALFAPFMAFAEAGDCSKLAAFKQNQESKLLLSRYGLGMINAQTLDALRAQSWDRYLAAVATCGKEAK